MFAIKSLEVGGNVGTSWSRGSLFTFAWLQWKIWNSEMFGGDLILVERNDGGLVWKWANVISEFIIISRSLSWAAREPETNSNAEIFVWLYQTFQISFFSRSSTFTLLTSPMSDLPTTILSHECLPLCVSTKTWKELHHPPPIALQRKCFRVNVWIIVRLHLVDSS